MLTVDVYSFSYRRGVPEDPSGNGGGYVFDCRALHNPGRYEPYKQLTGRDEAVQQFLREQSTIEAFLSHVYAMVDESVAVYSRRGFEHLQVAFGCTGGQHRSVYCAEHLAAHIRENFPADQVAVNLIHREHPQR